MATRKMQTVLICLAVFVLVYFEQIRIGPIKLSLWKLPVISFLTYFSLKGSPSKNGLFLVALLLAGKLLLNEFMFFGGTETINEAMYVMILPVTFNYFREKYSGRPNSVRNILVITAIMFLLSALPFIMNLIPQSRLLSIDEGEEASGKALTGIFYHMATSSKVFVIATVVILFNKEFFTSTKKTWMWYLLIAYGCYCVFSAFTRTGWLLLLTGFIIYLYQTIHISKFLLFISAAAIILSLTYVSIIASVDRDSAFYKRVIGESKHTTNDELDANKLSSGRFKIYKSSINGVVDEGITAILFGIGKDYSIRKNRIAIGSGYIAHNRFIEIFCYGGIIALVIFMIYIIKLGRMIFKLDDRNKSKKLLICLFLLLVITYIPSHGFPMYSDFLFGIALAAGYIEYTSKKRATISNMGTKRSSIV
jgi:O-antigen ligase